MSCKDGGFLLRVFERKANRKKGARLLIKCGCCDQSVEVYFGHGTLEINGVIASVPEWRRVLGPLLRGPGY